MRHGRILRGILALAAALTFSAAGVLTFASAASAAATLTVTPSTGLQPQGSTVVSVSGADLTVRAKDGTTWTWVLESKSVVRENGQRVASSTLASGNSVFVGGVLAGTTRDAKLTVIR